MEQCFIVEFDSMGGGCTRSGEWIQGYLEHLAADAGQSRAMARQRIRRVWADTSRQGTGYDCGFFAAGRIPGIARAEWGRLLHALNACSQKGVIPAAQCHDPFPTFDQGQANVARAHLREHLRDRIQALTELWRYIKPDVTRYSGVTANMM